MYNKIIIPILFFVVNFSAQNQTWEGFGDPNDRVNVIEVHNGEMYCGGRFSEIAGMISRVAKWNGTLWTNVGNGFSNSASYDEIYDLHSNNGILYANCGDKLYYLDGNNWVYINYNTSYGCKIGTYGNGIIFHSSSNGVVVGSVGSFNTLSSGYFEVFKEFNGHLYAGGNGLYKWDGSSWNDITGTTSGGSFQINALEVYQNKLLIAGDFGSIGGIIARSIAFYDGVNFSNVGDTTLAEYIGQNSFNLEGVLLSGNHFYIYSWIFSSNFLDFTNIIRFDGLNWYHIAPPGIAQTGIIKDLEFYNSELFLGGAEFTIGNDLDYLFKYIGDPLNSSDASNLNNLVICPNPTQDKITIDIKGYNGEFMTKVYNLQGGLLEISNKSILSLKKYDKGLYFLKVSYGDITEEFRIIRY